MKWVFSRVKLQCFLAFGPLKMDRPADLHGDVARIEVGQSKQRQPLEALINLPHPPPDTGC